MRNCGRGSRAPIVIQTLGCFSDYAIDALHFGFCVAAGDGDVCSLLGGTMFLIRM